MTNNDIQVTQGQKILIFNFYLRSKFRSHKKWTQSITIQTAVSPAPTAPVTGIVPNPTAPTLNNTTPNENQQYQQYQRQMQETHNLGRREIRFTCPACGIQDYTKLDYEANFGTYILCVSLFSVALCCCPFICPCTKDVVHKCRNCGKRLGKQKMC